MGKKKSGRSGKKRKTASASASALSEGKKKCKGNKKDADSAESTNAGMLVQKVLDGDEECRQAFRAFVSSDGGKAKMLAPLVLEKLISLLDRHSSALSSSGTASSFPPMDTELELLRSAAEGNKVDEGMLAFAREAFMRRVAKAADEAAIASEKAINEAKSHIADEDCMYTRHDDRALSDENIDEWYLSVFTRCFGEDLDAVRRDPAFEGDKPAIETLVAAMRAGKHDIALRSMLKSAAATETEITGSNSGVFDIDAYITTRCASREEESSDEAARERALRGQLAFGNAVESLKRSLDAETARISKEKDAKGM